MTRYNNLDEGVLLKNLLSQVIDTSSKAAVEIKTNRISPRLLTIASQGAKGILIKEQAYPGWQADIKSKIKSQHTKIYKAGPTIPGYMYIRIPKALQNELLKVTFVYQGSVKMWSLLILSMLVSLFLLDAALLNGLLLGRTTQRIYKKLKAQSRRWWEKEDEDSQ